MIGTMVHGIILSGMNFDGTDYDWCMDQGIVFGSNNGDFAEVNMDEVSIWDRALTQKDVNELYGFRLENHPNLVGYWALNENIGTDTYDMSGSALGAATLNNGALWADGYFGSGVQFDGIDDYVQVGTQFTDLDEISYGAWVNLDATSGTTQTMFSQYYSKFRITVTTGNSYFCELAGGGASPWVYGPTAVGTEGEWHHHVCTYNKVTGHMNYYIDGVDTDTGSFNDDTGWDASAGAQVNIGGHGGGSWPFGGYLDEVFIMNADIGANEVAQLYNSQRNEHTPLIAYWQFEDGSGTTPVDSSGNNYHAEFGDNPSWSTTSKVGSGSLHFDGTADHLNTGIYTTDFDSF